MKNIILLCLLLGATNLTLAKTPPVPDKSAPPRIEVCFVLDTTG